MRGNDVLERYSVVGMTCSHCVDGVTAEVCAVTGVTTVNVDLAAAEVTVAGDRFDDRAVRAAIEEAGFEVAPS